MGGRGSRAWPPRLVCLVSQTLAASPCVSAAEQTRGRASTPRPHSNRAKTLPLIRGVLQRCLWRFSGFAVVRLACRAAAAKRPSRAAQPRGTRGKDALVPRRTAKPVRRVCRDPPAHPALVSASRGQFDHKFDAKGEGRGPRERCGDGQTDGWWRSVRELDASQSGGDEQMQGAWL